MSSHFSRALPALCLTLIFAACDDSTTNQDEHHLEAFGVALVQGVDTLLRSTSGNAEEVRGALALQLGQSRGPLLLHFLDEAGHWFRPEADPDGEHSFALDLGATSYGVVVDSLDWSFTATGLQMDSTTLVVRVLHQGHDDYVSPALPVLVTP